MRITATSPINGEESIIWFDPITRLAADGPPDFEWIRESTVYAPSRRGPIKVGRANLLLGYSTIARRGQTRNLSVGVFVRRLFWRKKTDDTRVGIPPCSAVDPKTIQPGKPGEPVGERARQAYAPRSKSCMS